MAKYQKAKPFDIIQNILDTRTAVKQLQVQMPAPAPASIPPTVIGAWQACTLASGWVGGNSTTVNGVFNRYWGSPFNLVEVIGDILSTTLSGTIDAFTLTGTAPNMNQNHDIMNGNVANAAWLWVQTTGVCQAINYTTNQELGIHVLIPLGPI